MLGYVSLCKFMQAYVRLIKASPLEPLELIARLHCKDRKDSSQELIFNVRTHCRHIQSPQQSPSTRVSTRISIVCIALANPSHPRAAVECHWLPPVIGMWIIAIRDSNWNPTELQLNTLRLQLQLQSDRLQPNSSTAAELQTNCDPNS